ncbi:MAG: molecular chaperone DnaK [Dehalococcoidia bacterium]|nr:molecular chaperone DnaK [Dehalococcoidia bacterium]
MPRIIGIDLGTTNSCVAVVEGGQPTVIPSAEGNRTTPSVVAVSQSGERLVGLMARRQMVTNPEHTIVSIKRFMGRRASDPEIQRTREMVPYGVAETSGGDVRVTLRGQEYAPPEVSAMVLQKLRADAEQYLGEPVTQAVITVPAYFNDSQRQATEDAGKIAGLEVLRIINEPTASALAFGLEQEGDRKLAVYDLGGGTFDISILELGDGVFEVRSTNGNTHLGGDDFDDRIVDWLIAGFASEHGVDLRSDKMALQRVKEAAEKAKCELSSVLQTEVNLPFVTADASGPKHLNVVLTRAKVEQLVTDLIERTEDPCRQALEDAHLKAGDIDEVILVGGQTRMPAVRELVTRVFEKEPRSGVNPDEVVALGAAVQAAVLAGDVQDVVLLDVTPLSLGIETKGGIFTRLIERNTTIPTSKTQTFTTVSDKQHTVAIHVLQGERDLVAHNHSLGRFELTDLAEGARGTPQIDVTFDIDANGIVKVSARDRASGREQAIPVTGAAGLAEEEIEQMVADAREHEAEDTRVHEMVEAGNVADMLAYHAERTLDKVGGRLSKQERQALEAQILDLRSALVDDDLAVLRERTEVLRATLLKTGERVYHEEVTQTESRDGQPAAATDAETAGEQDDPTATETPPEGKGDR